MIAKKTLMAAAVFSALAGVAHAQVKLYGMVDMSVGSFENAGGDRTTEVASGKMMTSYFGLSGSEDLGGGLKAEFVLESFLAADDGRNLPNEAGGFWGRGSWVGLSGSFGRVAVGQYDNPLFTYGYTYNPFGSSMAFSPTMRHYYYGQGNVVQANGGTGLDTGFVNSVTFETPVVGGFMGTLQYSPKESGDSASYAAAVSYNAGPLSAALTYVKSGISTAYDADEKIWALGASYDFGVAKAFLQYTAVDQDTSTAGALGLQAANKDSIYQLGVSVPLSDKASVMASYGKQSNKLGASDTKESDTVLSLGYSYALSKRTDVYGVFTNNQHTGETSGQTFAVGIRHNF